MKLDSDETDPSETREDKEELEGKARSALI